MALPSVLQQAIDAAAASYGISPGILERLWQWESGGTYPNPYVNNPAQTGLSVPYGGLFGLGQGQTYYGVGPVNNLDTSPASVQMQANAAATEVAHLIQHYGGDVTAAINAYDGGSSAETAYVVGGNSPTGYTPGSGGSTGSTGASTYQPVSLTGDIGGAFGSVTGFFGNIGRNLGNLGAAAGAVAAGSSGNVGNAVTFGVTSALENVLGGLLKGIDAWFSSGEFLNPAFVVSGGLVIILGLYVWSKGEISGVELKAAGYSQ